MKGDALLNEACRTMPSLRDLPARYQVILCDIWGCVHDGVRAHASAVALLRDWRAQGRTIVLLTNAPRPSARVRAQLEKLGVDEGCYDAVVSSGDAGVEHLIAHHADEPLGFIGTDDDRRALEEAGITCWDEERAKTVVCMGYRPEEAEEAGVYDRVLAGMHARDATLLCFNPDLVVGHGDRTLFCAGTIAKRYEAMGGQVLYFGKPHRPIYDRALKVAAERRGQAVAKDEVLAIGDGVATDVRGAVEYGLDFLFVSGGIEADRFEELGAAAFVERLRQTLGRERVAPIAIVPRLA